MSTYNRPTAEQAKRLHEAIRLLWFFEDATKNSTALAHLQPMAETWAALGCQLIDFSSPEDWAEKGFRKREIEALRGLEAVAAAITLMQPGLANANDSEGSLLNIFEVIEELLTEGIPQRAIA